MVDISRKNGHLIMSQPDELNIGTTPLLRRSKYTTAELVAKITDENMPEYIDFGPPVGREIGRAHV